MTAAKNETAIDPFAVDLGGSQELPPLEALSKGWHKFSLVDYEMVDKPDGDENNPNPRRYVTLSLQHAETGAPRRAFVNWPMPKDATEYVVSNKTGQNVMDKDGNPMTRAGSKLAVIKTVISALGGPESGRITPDTFAQLVGNSAMFNVTVSEYPEGSGQYRDQIDLMFGKGIKPA